MTVQIRTISYEFPSITEDGLTYTEKSYVEGVGDAHKRLTRQDVINVAGFPLPRKTFAPISYRIGKTKSRAIDIMAGAPCVNVSVRPIKEGQNQFFQVDATYETPGQWLRRPQFRQSTMQYEIPAPKVYRKETTFGVSGEHDLPYVGTGNSTGDPIDPPIMKTQSRTILDIIETRLDKKWDAKGFSAETRNEYLDSINLVDVKIGGTKIEAGHGRMLEANLEPHELLWSNPSGYAEWIFFWRAHFKIEIAKEGHNERREDAGFRFTNASGHKQQFTDVDGQPVTTPQLLDGSGGPLADGETPVLYFYQNQRAQNWESLNLPAEAFEVDPLDPSITDSGDD